MDATSTQLVNDSFASFTTFLQQGGVPVFVVFLVLFVSFFFLAVIWKYLVTAIRKGGDVIRGKK